MANRSVKWMLFAIVVLLFDVNLALASSGMGIVVVIIAIVGLAIGIEGLTDRAR